MGLRYYSTADVVVACVCIALIIVGVCVCTCYTNLMRRKAGEEKNLYTKASAAFNKLFQNKRMDKIARKIDAEKVMKSRNLGETSHVIDLTTETGLFYTGKLLNNMIARGKHLEYFFDQSEDQNWIQIQDTLKVAYLPPIKESASKDSIISDHHRNGYSLNVQQQRLQQRPKREIILFCSPEEEKEWFSTDEDDGPEEEEEEDSNEDVEEASREGEKMALNSRSRIRKGRSLSDLERGEDFRNRAVSSSPKPPPTAATTTNPSPTSIAIVPSPSSSMTSFVAAAAASTITRSTAKR